MSVTSTLINVIPEWDLNTYYDLCKSHAYHSILFKAIPNGIYVSGHLMWEIRIRQQWNDCPIRILISDHCIRAYNLCDNNDTYVAKQLDRFSMLAVAEIWQFRKLDAGISPCVFEISQGHGQWTRNIITNWSGLGMDPSSSTFHPNCVLKTCYMMETTFTE